MLKKFSTVYAYAQAPGKRALTTPGPFIWAETQDEAETIAAHVQPVGGQPGGLAVVTEVPLEGDQAQAGVSSAMAKAVLVRQ